MEDTIKQLQEFLNAHAINSSNSSCQEITHVSLTGGKYSITDDFAEIRLYELIAKYCRCLVTESYIPVEYTSMQLLEIPTEISNLHIDIDLHVNTERRQYNQVPFISKFIDGMNNCIKDTLELNDNDLQSFVLERASIVEKGSFWSDGIHIVYPHVLCNKATRLHIRKLFLERYSPVFDLIDTINKPCEILDEATFKNNAWFLVGCGKQGVGRTYLPTKEYFIHRNKLSSSEIDSSERCSYETIAALSIRHKSNEALPVKESVKLLIKEIDNTIKNELYQITNMTDAELLALVKMLNPSRADNYTEWITVGIALFNYAKSGGCSMEDSLSAFHEFSKLSPKYNANETSKKFKSFHEASNGSSTVTIATIRYFASLDSPDEYSEWKRNQVESDYLSLITHETLDFANVYFKVENFEDLYAFYAKHWYSYDGVIWNQKDDLAWADTCCKMRHFFSNIIDKRIHELEQIISVSEGEAKEEYQRLWKIQMKALAKIKNHPFIENVRKELVIKLTRKYGNLFKGLDTDIYKIAFNNGIYELNEGTFRKSNVSDLLTKKIDIKYDPDFIGSEKYINDIVFLKQFFSDLFPLEELREYVLTNIAGFLEGRNRYQDFFIFLGIGSNGKSVLMEFLQYILHDYSGSVSVSLITDRRASSSQATPDLARIQGKRLVTMQEPDHNAVLQCGVLKELTGNDRIVARGLYESPVEFVPQASFICACNTLPVVSNFEDFGTFRRLKIIPFETRFLPNYDPDKPHATNERPCVIDIIDKLKDAAETFVHWILHEYYPLYIKSKPFCEKVESEVNKYQNEMNYYKSFIDENVVYEEGAKISIRDLYTSFKKYIQENYSQKGIGSIKYSMFKDKLLKYYNFEKESNSDIIVNHALVDM